jgi:UDP-N-acetylglucosamine 2-epimerase (non-hydrolysing)
MAPVIRAIQRTDSITPYIVHTNQHYDNELSKAFFRNLNLPSPDRNLQVGSGTQGEQTADGLVGVERVLEARSPPIVLAQGDTNAVLSTAIATSKIDVLFGHVEAGIRSFDRSMPEEVNRVLADQVTDLAFAPTPEAVENLAAEGVTEDVYVTGNTVVDACREHLEISNERSDILTNLELKDKNYIVATIHRPRNTDTPTRLRRVITELDKIDSPVILPAHPRTKKRIDLEDLTSNDTLRIVPPLDYLDFLKLEANAEVIVTDSGGIQEEASILEIPCLTVRPNTERSETVDAGVNKLVKPEEISELVHQLKSSPAVYESMQGCTDLYGDGTAGQQIVEVICSKI